MIRLGAIAGLFLAASPAAAQPNWQAVEADNGAAYKVDLNSISHYANGGAHIIVYAVEGADYNPGNLRRLYFDCRGHYRDETGPIGPITYAPPRSVAGKMGDIACAHDFGPADRALPKYKSRYVISGFLMQAGQTCGDVDRFVDASIFVTSDVPPTTPSQEITDILHGWIMEGAEDFKRQALKDGVQATCATAKQALQEATDAASRK